MQIFADENMPLVQQFFADSGTVTLFDGRNVSAAQLKDADVLLVRSVTQVNESLLAENSKLCFVGTATIGTDHVDQQYLARRNIVFSSAPGCNAQSVMEYVLSSLWLLAERYQWQLADKVVAVVGVGNIGRRLVQALQALNIQVLQCDPVRAANEPDFPHTDFAEVCRHADVISFHTPLTKNGPDASYHMLAKPQLLSIKPDCAIINASRGAVIDNSALLESQREIRRPLVLDVWENEPHILTDLLPYTDIATAHIAGHSVEGKARGTEMLYQACTKLQQKPARQTLANLLAVPAVEKVQISPNFGLPDVQNLARLLYDVRRDDALFRNYLHSNGFDWLRKHYPARREFSSLQLSGKVVPDYLQQLGFSLA